jgi:antitoxin YefM
MIVANFTEFRADLKKYLDQVEDENEMLILKRGSGKGTVMISMAEYNSMMETIHLLKSKTNASNLHESLQQSQNGNYAQILDVSDL